VKNSISIDGSKKFVFQGGYQRQQLWKASRKPVEWTSGRRGNEFFSAILLSVVGSKQKKGMLHSTSGRAVALLATGSSGC